MAHQRVAVRPCDDAVHGRPRRRIEPEAVPDPVAVSSRTSDTGPGPAHHQVAAIVRLTAAARVERGLRQQAPSLGAVQDRGIELRSIGVVEVEPGGHGGRHASYSRPRPRVTSRSGRHRPPAHPCAPAVQVRAWPGPLAAAKLPLDATQRWPGQGVAHDEQDRNESGTDVHMGARAGCHAAPAHAGGRAGDPRRLGDAVRHPRGRSDRSRPGGGDELRLQGRGLALAWAPFSAARLALAPAPTREAGGGRTRAGWLHQLWAATRAPRRGERSVPWGELLNEP